ncbi:MAG: hypothetical protein KAH17_09210 [Bacteroidales bacterium]|nr:hypothetical protein [Bacteroidales bacterium]
MKSSVLISLLIIFSGQIIAQNTNDDPIAIFNFSLDFKLNNDQGDLSTKEYLKLYGTKGKSRAHEEMYPVLIDFFINEFEEDNFPIESIDHLANIKANVYGIPVMSLGKAVKSKRSERYLRIILKDIGQIPPGQMAGTAGQATIKVVKMRCRIQLYDSDKNLLKMAEGFFATGEKVGSQYDVGVDLRNQRGDARQQEIKCFEVCCKMAFLRALEKL